VRPLYLDLPADPSTPGVVRRELRARLPSHPASDDVILCASELVTNAVQYTGTPVLVELDITDDRVRVAVHDCVRDLPVRRPIEPLARSGRGLHLVEILSTRWGAEPTRDGKVVWFELVMSRPA
jgi:anti-sigma regulatory factor (Ser/Thr protein kinase)